MSYMEMEQFLGRGEEKAVWIFSFKNVGGLIVGGFLGHRLFSVLGWTGGLVFVGVLLGAAIGITLTFQRRGVLIARRLLIMLRFYIRRAVAARRIDATTLYTVVEQREQLVRVRRRSGSAIIGARRGIRGGTRL
jgi:hypothetical protein